MKKRPGTLVFFTFFCPAWPLLRAGQTHFEILDDSEMY